MATSKDQAPTEWTLLAYFAGDNDLAGAAKRDVDEIEAGSRFPVNAAVHLDSKGTNTQVIEFTGGKKTIKRSRRNENAGNPKVLTKFLQDGQTRFPSKKYLVVISNHGSGLFNYAETVKKTTVANRRDAKFLSATRFSLFETTARRALETYVLTADVVHFNAVIANDDTSRDLLEGTELQSGIQEALATPGDRFAIIGCDACFMSMVEVVFDLRELGEIFVGSQELEEPAGWPYTEVMRGISATSKVEQAATAIVDEFVKATNKDFPDSVLSAIYLSKIDALVTALNKLGELLVPLLATNLIGIAKAKAKTKFFKLYDYIDLRHFAENLITHLPGNTAVEQAAQAVIQAVKNAILENGNKAVSNANGLSTYLPDSPVNREYAKVLMCLAAPKWHDFVTGYGILRSTLT